MAVIPMPTTGANLRAHLQASLRERGCRWSGSFGELAEVFKALGIRDNDEIASVEIGIAQNGTGRIVAERDEFGRWEIRELVE